MAIVGWIVSMCALLGGLALRQDLPFVHADEIASGLLFAAFLTFPPFWSGKPMGIGAKPRVVLCLAMALAIPVILLRP